MTDRKEDLFTKGIRAFNDGNYYDAHEFWEDLWSDYYFSDRLYVQGLIQMSVGYYHITNQNLKGAKGLSSSMTSVESLEIFRPLKEFSLPFIKSFAPAMRSNNHVCGEAVLGSKTL